MRKINELIQINERFVNHVKLNHTIPDHTSECVRVKAVELADIVLAWDLEVLCGWLIDNGEIVRIDALPILNNLKNLLVVLLVLC